MKKNLLALLLAALMTSSLVACSGNFEINDDEKEEEKDEEKDEDEDKEEDKDDKDESKAEGSFLPETNAPQPVAPETVPSIPAPAPADTTYMAPETAAPEAVAPDTAAPETAAPETEAPIITESVPPIETATPAPVPPAPTAPQTPAGMSIDRNVTVMYNGNEQEFFDADGNKIYPIDYNGVTYLPVDNIADMFNIASDYDSGSDTVLLGAYNDYMDFIETLTPYSSTKKSNWCQHVTLGVGKEVAVAGYTYKKFIIMGENGEAFYYNLEGKYQSLVFDAYHTDRDVSFEVIGDTGIVLSKVDVKGKNLPVKVTVDLTGIKQLTIKLVSGDSYYSDGHLIITDAKIK